MKEQRSESKRASTDDNIDDKASNTKSDSQAATSTVSPNRQNTASTTTSTNSLQMMEELANVTNHESLEWRRHDSLEHMRHKTEFEMIQTLGRGAFGTTFQVRNKVDSNIYALKRVYLGKTAPDEQARRVLQKEVRVLSSLNHENVVRYYGAWVEQGSGEEEHDDEKDGYDTSGNTIFGGGYFSSSDKSWSPTCRGGNRCDQSNNSSGMDSTDDKLGLPQQKDDLVTCNLCHCTYTDWEVSLEHWGLIDAVLESKFLCQSCYLESLPAHIDPSTIHIREKQIMPYYLFILMEYCESTLQETLDFIHSENATKIDANTGLSKDRRLWAYFSQCVQGLEHCHSKGIIHRDIKPQNIFVHKGVIKLGDLGLATYNKTSSLIAVSTSKSHDSQEDDSNNANDNDNDNHFQNDQQSTRHPSSNTFPETDDKNSLSSQIGTYLYSAPEVQTGSYDEKCDIFSLGVVMVEMWHKFSTGMERAKVLSELHYCRVPSDWGATTHPAASQLARSMVATDPKLRPSCSQILARLLQEGLWEQNNSVELERLVSDLQICSSNLQKSLEEKDQTIKRLRELLSQNNIAHDHIL